MKAVVPLNVTALRVSNPDWTGVTTGFGGRTAAFESLPHTPGAGQASTGDTIWQPLAVGGSPAIALETGVHLHWELPEYFKTGRQDPDLGAITFPPAPPRWLVVRSLSIYDPAAGGYGAPQHASWVVESDYISPTPPLPDRYNVTRTSVAVPLTAANGTPYMYLGRVVEAASWNPATEQAADYLPSRTAAGGAALRLTSVGFVGAAFSGYYPDCRSVFGFWDTFADVKAVHDPISQLGQVKFRASYSVTGWLPDAGDDPLTTLAATVTREYSQYVAQCKAQNAKITSTPADFFAQVTGNQLGWEFSSGAISYTLAADDTLATLQVPDGTLCAGVIQDVVWDQLNPPQDTPFLAAPGTGPWTDEVGIAVGNTTVEAVSALVKSHLDTPAGTAVLASYETLLDALQLGLLRDIEGQGNALATLEQALHSGAFAQVDGGHQWSIQTKAAPGSQASAALTLPLTLAEQLSVLNAAQLAYDQARTRLVTARQQLFMDWVIYVKQLCRPPGGTNVVDTNTLGAFLASSSSGELRAVVSAGTAAGLLHYATDADTGRITGISTTSAAGTLAGAVAAAYATVAAALAALANDWELDAIPAAPFWMPTDPVLVLEGDRLEPARRNGPTRAIAVRTDAELIGTLQLAGAAGSWAVTAGSVAGLPAPPAAVPAAQAPAAAAAVAEAALLDPQYATAIAAATGAPAAAGLGAAITAAAGGQSPLDPPVSAGLYGAVHAAGFQRAANPAQAVQAAGQQLTVTFTNPAGTALPPDAVAWSAQAALPEFSPSRVDPFLPVWLIWELRLDPLARAQGGSYAAGALESQFSLDGDETDIGYPAPAGFTTGTLVTYRGAVVLSKKPLVSLTQQIDRYLAEFPQDAAGLELGQARDYLAGRKVMSQALDTFSSAQTLRTTIPQIPVADLVHTPDVVTNTIRGFITATPGDSWYDTGFNAITAISTGSQALYNFGPLRAGFLEVMQLTIVDVFGQVMTLSATRTPAGALTVTPTADLSPQPGDTANAAKAYLPPRALAPARVDAHWLSAAHNTGVPSVTTDFVEVNDHPATSPVCGWIVPNHLDVSLAFYDEGGSPIGSFGLEHGVSRYRTRAGNTANTLSDPVLALAADIGPADGTPLVNPHVARLMWFVSGQPAGFLTDLMGTIEDSDQFINPASFGQDASLSVLVGRPLAIVRTVQSISTAGGVLPASQGNTAAGDALGRAVAGRWYDYAQRQAGTCAGLDQVRIPVRLGDLTNIDDGLVAFLPEAAGAAPYSVVYSAAAPENGTSGVLRPGPDTIELTLNGPPLTFTALVDPRAPVHVTTGVLPTATMAIPPDQYLRAMQQLAVTFTAWPLLTGQGALSGQDGPGVPLPDITGFGWSWILFGQAPAPLAPQPAPDIPSYGYSPQRLLEGWLDLVPNPPIPDTAPPEEGATT